MVVDRATGEITRGEVPPYAVVAQGALPDLGPMRAALRDGGSPACSTSTTIRTARSRTSDERRFVVLLVMASSPQELRPPEKPGLFGLSSEGRCIFWKSSSGRLTSQSHPGGLTFNVFFHVIDPLKGIGEGLMPIIRIRAIPVIVKAGRS